MPIPLPFSFVFVSLSVSGTGGDQKKESDALGLELQRAVNHYMGAENQTSVCERAAIVPSHRAFSPSLIILIPASSPDAGPALSCWQERICVKGQESRHFLLAQRNKILKEAKTQSHLSSKCLENRNKQKRKGRSKNVWPFALFHENVNPMKESELTNPATTQAQSQGYELAHSNIHPTDELLEHVKGTRRTYRLRMAGSPWHRTTTGYPQGAPVRAHWVV